MSDRKWPRPQLAVSNTDRPTKKGGSASGEERHQVLWAPPEQYYDDVAFRVR